jgi:MFS family permease
MADSPSELAKVFSRVQVRGCGMQVARSMPTCPALPPHHSASPRTAAAASACVIQAAGIIGCHWLWSCTACRPGCRHSWLRLCCLSSQYMSRGFATIVGPTISGLLVTRNWRFSYMASTSLCILNLLVSPILPHRGSQRYASSVPHRVSSNACLGSWQPLAHALAPRAYPPPRPLCRYAPSRSASRSWSNACRHRSPASSCAGPRATRSRSSRSSIRARITTRALAPAAATWPSSRWCAACSRARPPA